MIPFRRIIIVLILIVTVAGTNAQLSENNLPQITTTPNNRLGIFINQNSSGAILYKSNHSNGDSFIRNLKESFKGNSIYIDIWATWCSPCLKELPSTIKLSSEAKDLPIKFVYLCTTAGTTQENWINKINQLQLSGTHILIEDALLMQVVKIFRVGVYPGYVLIDNNGLNKKDGIAQDGSTSIRTIEKLISK